MVAFAHREPRDQTACQHKEGCEQERAGMGFTIMESFMDAVKVRSTPGKGTVVTLRRRVSRRMGAPV